MSRTTIPGIYKITFKYDGRMYIGSSINIHNRWYNHKKLNSGQVICRALKKYGIENFDWDIIETVSDLSKLTEREQYYLDYFKPFVDLHQGFNVRKIADSNLGVKASNETRQKQSIAKKGKKFSATHIENMKKNWRGKRNDSYFENASIRMLGLQNPATRPEIKEKISKSKIGVKWSDENNYEIRIKEHIQRATNTMNILHSTVEFKEKMKNIHTGSKRSDSSKKKMSDWQQRTYEIISPTGEIFFLQSKDLKEFCSQRKLGYSNLQQTSKTLKSYKGWLCKISN